MSGEIILGRCAFNVVAGSQDSPVVTERILYLKGHLLNPGKSQKVHHWT